MFFAREECELQDTVVSDFFFHGQIFEIVQKIHIFHFFNPNTMLSCAKKPQCLI